MAGQGRQRHPLRAALHCAALQLRRLFLPQLDESSSSQWRKRGAVQRLPMLGYGADAGVYMQETRGFRQYFSG